MGNLHLRPSAARCKDHFASCNPALRALQATTRHPKQKPLLEVGRSSAKLISKEGCHSKKARLGPLGGLPLGGVGGLSSLMAAIQVSVMGCGVGGSSSTSSAESPVFGVPFEFGGRGCINLGTITKSLPSTRMAPAASNKRASNTPFTRCRCRVGLACHMPNMRHIHRAVLHCCLHSDYADPILAVELAN